MFELRAPVGDVAGAASAELAATIYFPDKLAKPNVVIFGVPGGGYSRGYFDMRFEGHAGYSEAEYHTARGITFIAVDHIGVGESTIPDLAKITLPDLAACYDRAVRWVLAKLADGSLGVEKVVNPFVVGIGQSMGGCVTIVTQGEHQSFDAIGVLGYSAIHTKLPTPPGEAAFVSGAKPGAGSAFNYRWAFHADDEPEDIVQADMANGYPMRNVPAPVFGSATVPHVAVTMMQAGRVAKEAAAITVPVFIGDGARDVCPDPHAEPGAYASAFDVTLMIVPNMSHMHNFASTRRLLWARLADWAESLARVREN